MQASQKPREGAFTAPAKPATQVAKSRTYQIDGPSAVPGRKKVVEFKPREAFCKIQVSLAGIPTGGEVKLTGFSYDEDSAGNSGLIAFVNSSECPRGLFSKIRIDARGRLEEVIDCRTTTKEKLYVASGIQGNIDDVEPEVGRMPLVISGAGFFVVQCANAILLKRSGKFEMSEGGLKLGDCTALSKNGDAFQFGEVTELDDHGCTEDGRCLAVADPSLTEIAVLNRETFAAKNGFPHAGLIEPKIFSGALENLDDPDAGPMGPNWQKPKNQSRSPPASRRDRQNLNPCLKTRASGKIGES